MLKNSKISLIDNAMIERRIYDEDRDAQRVVIVSGELPEIKFPDYSSFFKWVKVCMVAQIGILTLIMLLLIIRR
jgi:hypothetical protein